MRRRDFLSAMVVASASVAGCGGDDTQGPQVTTDGTSTGTATTGVAGIPSTTSPSSATTASTTRTTQTATETSTTETSTTTRPTTVDPATAWGPDDPDRWDLAFEEDFEGEGLDTDVWRDKYRWGRTHQDDAYMAASNVEVRDSKLILTGERKAQGGRTFTSGVVSSKDLFRYGWFVAKIKAPEKVSGLWPNFWITDPEWPPEFDLYEFYSGSHPEAHYHWEEPLPDYRDFEHEQAGQTAYQFDDMHRDFHYVGLDWRPQRAVWYVDGVETWRYEDRRYVSHSPMEVLFDFGIGTLEDDAVVPESWGGDTYEVDWFRVYEERGFDDETPPPAPTNLEAHQVEADSFVVSWDHDADEGGSDLSHFEVTIGEEFEREVGNFWVEVDDAPAGSSHDVAVVAVDRAGNESDPATITVQTG